MRRVAGFGCREGASLAALRQVFAQAVGDGAVDALATLESRAQALRPLAQALGLPLIAMPSAALSGIATPTQSPRILALHATGCVAEAVALAALGPGARIVIPRLASHDGSATAAIASLEAP